MAIMIPQSGNGSSGGQLLLNKNVSSTGSSSYISIPVDTTTDMLNLIKGYSYISVLAYCSEQEIFTNGILNAEILREFFRRGVSSSHKYFGLTTGYDPSVANPLLASNFQVVATTTSVNARIYVYGLSGTITFRLYGFK